MLLRGRGRRLVIVVLLCAALVIPSTAGARTGSPQRQLEQARAELQRLASEIDQAEATSEAASLALEDADAKLRAIEAVVNDVAAQVERQRAAVGDAERRLAQVVAERDVLAEALADRVARLYKQGPTATFDLLLASDAAGDALARGTLLARVAEGEQVDLERLAAAEIAVAAERERFQAEEDRLAGLLAEQEELLAEAVRLRESRALEAAAARDRVANLSAEADDLEEEQEALEALIRRQQEEERRRREAQRRAAEQARRAAEQERRAAASSAGGGGVSSSGFAWPICAPVTSEYGPRWGRMHRGIDLGAPTGTPIGAAKAGTVIYAGWQGGYGRLVLVDHNDGVVTAYAHMSSIGVGAGTSVSRGQTIGRVGSTGNSTGPHLHLETRVNGSAVNPRQYLRGSPC